MADRRRVIVIGPQFGGDDGVSELGRQVIHSLAVDPGVRVLVRSLHDDQPVRLSDAPCEFAPSHGSRGRLIATLLRDAARGSATDIVVAVHAHFLPTTLPLLARGATLASILIGIESWRPLTALQRAALSRASHVIAISRHTRDRFLAANRSAARVPIVVCHPAAPDTGNTAASPLAPGFALMVGRMSREERYKGHDEVLDAWPRVLASHPDARLAMVGDGDDRLRLQQKAHALGLDGSVSFPGHLSRAALNGAYADAAFFVMPSRDEGFGFVYLEAMRAGKACIACEGAAAEILEHRRSGELVRFGSVDDITAACLRLFSNAAIRAQLGGAAAESVRERFLMEHFVQRFRRALELSPAVATPSMPQACA